MTRSQGALPEKLFFRIGEVASLVGVEPHVLRYWEREFRSIRPMKSAKGQRVYSRRDVENLFRVRDLLYRDGFTIAGAKKKLHEAREGDGPASAEAGEPTIDEAAIAEEPEASVVRASSLAGAPAEDDPVREKLLDLRNEVEGFLAELSALSTSDPRDTRD